MTGATDTEFDTRRLFTWHDQPMPCLVGGRLANRKGSMLVCISDSAPCPENPLGRQIVADIVYQQSERGRRYTYKVRVYWDRSDDGRGHYPVGTRELPNGSSQSEGYPNSWATTGNIASAKRWAEGWLLRCLWQWDGCEVVR